MPSASEELAQFMDRERASLTASLPSKLAQMEADYSGGDFDAVERAAHSLYGSSGTFGLNDLSAACKALETAVESFKLSGSEANKASIDAALDEVRAAVAALTPPGAA